LKSFWYADQESENCPEKPRTDAQRNRERILEVAKKAFTRSGANASLDDRAQGRNTPGYRLMYLEKPIQPATYAVSVSLVHANPPPDTAALPMLDPEAVRREQFDGQSFAPFPSSSSGDQRSDLLSLLNVKSPRFRTLFKNSRYKDAT
jgi:hypothetical protein